MMHVRSEATASLGSSIIVMHVQDSLHIMQRRSHSSFLFHMCTYAEMYIIITLF